MATKKSTLTDLLNTANLELSVAYSVIDLVYTITCDSGSGGLESLESGSLNGAMYVAMQRIEIAKESIDAAFGAGQQAV